MATSGALYRMRLSYPSEFLPKAMFFYSTPFTEDRERDWFDCLPLKAAAIYFAVFRVDANEKTIEDAKRLLETISQKCDQVIQEKKLTQSTKPDATKEKKTQGSSTIPQQRADKATPVEEKKDQTKRKLRPDLTDEVLKTMDAVYMVMGFLRDLKEVDRESLDSYCMSRHGIHLVSDIAMVENQLPLDMIIDVVANLETAIKRAADESKLKKDSTLQPTVEKFKLDFSKDSFNDAVTRFSWYYSPFYVDWRMIKTFSTDVLKEKKNLLECLHHFIVQQVGKDAKIPTSKHVWPIPTVKELFRAGVQFRARLDQHIAIGFAAPVLSLPVLFFDAKLETVVLNLMAVESSMASRPVTRYFQLLKEMVCDVGDVKVLKKFGIVKGKWKKEEDVVNFVNKVDGFASYPSMYPVIDHEIEAVKNYHDQRMAKFFVRNRPALGWVYSIAAASLLATAIFAAKRRGAN